MFAGVRTVCTTIRRSCRNSVNPNTGPARGKNKRHHQLTKRAPWRETLRDAAHRPAISQKIFVLFAAAHADILPARRRCGACARWRAFENAAPRRLPARCPRRAGYERSTRSAWRSSGRPLTARPPGSRARARRLGHAARALRRRPPSRLAGPAHVRWLRAAARLRERRAEPVCPERLWRRVETELCGRAADHMIGARAALPTTPYLGSVDGAGCAGGRLRGLSLSVAEARGC